MTAVSALEKINNPSKQEKFIKRRNCDYYKTRIFKTMITYLAKQATIHNYIPRYILLHNSLIKLIRSI